MDSADNDESYDDEYDDDDPNISAGGKINQGRWSREEHDAFMQGLDVHGREWKKIAQLIPTRTVVQIRTHAQKYFQKMSKSDSRQANEAHSAKEKRTTSGVASHHSNLSSSSHSSERRATSSASLKLSAPKTMKDQPGAKDISAAAGGITPRTVAAATILLAPRSKTEHGTYTSEWMAKHSASAVQILERRRSSPRLTPTAPIWPVLSSSHDAIANPPPTTASSSSSSASAASEQQKLSGENSTFKPPGDHHQ